MTRFTVFGTLALAALAVASCTPKEAEIDVPVVPGQEITIQATREGRVTKTALQRDGSTIWWTAGDELSLFAADATGGGAKFVKEGDDAEASAAFTGTLNVVLGSDSTTPVAPATKIWGIYPYDTRNALAAEVLTVPFKTVQTATPGSFDPQAMVSVACSENLSLKFFNAYGVLKFKVGQPNVKTVTLKCNDPEHKFYSTYPVSLERGFPVLGAGSGDSSEGITLASFTAAFDQDEYYYMVVPPHTFSGVTFELTYMDNSNTGYISSDAEFTVVRSNFHELTNPLVGEVGGNTEPDYSGSWAIVGANTKDNVTSYYAARAFSSSNNNLRAASLTVSDLKDTCEMDDIFFKFTKVTEGNFEGYYTIQDKNDAYLYAASSGSNYLKAGAEPNDSGEYYWSVAENAVGGFDIVAQNTEMRNVMRFNYNNGSPLFSCYAPASTTGINVSLIPADDIEIVAIPEPTELVTVTSTTTWGSAVFKAGVDKYGTGEISSDFIFENLGFVAGGGKFKFGSDSGNARIQLGGTGTPGSKCSIQIKVAESGTLTLKARASGSATDRPLMVAVGATAVNGGNIVPTSSADIAEFSYPVTANNGDLINIYSGKSGINVYEIKWTPGAPVTPTYDFTTVAELNALATDTSAEHTGTLRNAVVSFVPNNNNAFITDGTGTVLLYKSNHGLKQGQAYSGEVTVDLVLYNGCSEITSINAGFTGDQAAVDPESVTLAALIADFSKYQNAYVKVERLTVSSQSSKNIYVTDGTNEYVVYDNTGTASCEAGDVITVVGTVTKFNSTEEIKAWAATDITVTAGAPKAVTFAQPSATGCSIAVTVGGSPIASGDKVAAGTTVTLTATVGSDYTFGGWTVSGARVADASATTTSFEMGAVAVSISAAFNSNSSTAPEYVEYKISESDWKVENGALTNGTVSFTGEGATFKKNSGYFMMGKNGAYLTFPEYDYPVSSIIITGNSGASGAVVQNIYVGDTAVSEDTTGATGENTYAIAAKYQAAGNIYVLKVTSNHNTQITKIKVVFAQ